MLQIITEKFYRPGERYETLHRAVFYTNYRMFRADRFETPVGILLPATGIEGLGALTCEVLEKIEKHPDGKKPGVMISTGGTSLLNDFAAVTAFALNITCTPDPDLTRRLLATDRPSLGVQAVPSHFVKRTFDRQVMAKDGDSAALAAFVTQLIGLERKRFEAAMRAIRQYITGLHRIAENLSLAYALLVMSVESLAQQFDGHVAEWGDYEQRKRVKIDAALAGAPDDVASKVREAVLANEHVAAARRFRDFAMAHIDRSFFRSEAASVGGPASRGDLLTGLQQAYAIRSRYVHTLYELPSALTVGEMPEAIELDDRVGLTIAGLARAARHIIMQFVARGATIAHETFNYQTAFPNVVTVRLASEYWIAATGGFTYKAGPTRLSALIEQLTNAVLLRAPNAKITDLRPVLTLVEGIVPGLQDVRQRLPLLSMYFLFHKIAGPDFACAQWPALFETYKSDFDTPSIESYVVHLFMGFETGWTLEQFEELHRQYFKNRHKAESTNLGRLLEAGFTLQVAEMNRASGNEARARELIAVAVEAHPSHAGLRGFEATLPADSLPKIAWEGILLPPRPFKTSSDAEGAAKTAS
jgi:hypothetical protein